MNDLLDNYLVVVEIKYPTEELTRIVLLRGFKGRKRYYIDPLIKMEGVAVTIKKTDKS